jgi:hypothetical protein
MFLLRKNSIDNYRRANFTSISMITGNMLCLLKMWVMNNSVGNILIISVACVIAKCFALL